MRISFSGVIIILKHRAKFTDKMPEETRLVWRCGLINYLLFFSLLRNISKWNFFFFFSGPKPSRMTSPKRQESLESIWKMITERYHVPRTRQPGTWEDHEHYVIESPSDNVNKIETYKKHLSPQPPLSSYRRLKVRKELSVGHQEFNRRVEAFIQNFNEELRKQRQESLNQYMEMISHDD